MKFEMPIAEIQKFDLKDIISASDEGGDTTPTTTVAKSQPGTVVGDMGGTCQGGKKDDYNFDACL